MIPGELFPEPGELELNVGRDTVAVSVANTGDRPCRWARTIISSR